MSRRITRAGGLVDALDDVGILDDTLIFFIIGDNGVSAEGTINGIQQAPREGVTMLPMLRDGTAPETQEVQYFEMLGNRGVFHQDWTVVTKHPDTVEG